MYLDNRYLLKHEKKIKKTKNVIKKSRSPT